MQRGFRDYLARMDATSRQPVFAFYHVAGDDVLAKFILGNMLKEDRRHVDLGKGREIFFHSAHVEPGQDHLHFRQNGAKLYAVNRDGTAHDASHGKLMARWAREGMRDNYPGFTVPKDGLIEALFDAPGGTLLLEDGAAGSNVIVPRTLQRLAEQAASS